MSNINKNFAKTETSTQNLPESSFDYSLIAFTSPRATKVKAAPASVSPPATLLINGKYRKFEASIIGNEANYLIYKDTTTAWSVTAQRQNGKLAPSDWAKGSYVFKQLEHQIQQAEGKHQATVPFAQSIYKKLLPSNSSSGQQVLPQDPNRTKPAKANWLKQAWLGYSENAARVYVSARQFLGADAKWVATTNNNIARNLYYKGADIHSPAFGVGKAVNNIGAGALAAEGVIAVLPETALAGVVGFVTRPAIKAGAPVFAALQTANGLKTRDAEQTAYGVAAGLPLFMGSLLGKFRSVKMLRAAPKALGNTQIEIQNGFSAIRNMHPEHIDAFAQSLLGANLKRFANTAEFPEFAQICLARLKPYKFMPNVKAAIAELESLGAVKTPAKQVGKVIVLFKPKPSAIMPKKPKTPQEIVSQHLNNPAIIKALQQSNTRQNTSSTSHDSAYGIYAMADEFWNDPEMIAHMESYYGMGKPEARQALESFKGSRNDIVTIRLIHTDLKNKLPNLRFYRARDIFYGIESLVGHAATNGKAFANYVNALRQDPKGISNPLVQQLYTAMKRGKISNPKLNPHQPFPNAQISQTDGYGYARLSLGSTKVIIDPKFQKIMPKTLIADVNKAWNIIQAQVKLHVLTHSNNLNGSQFDEKMRQAFERSDFSEMTITSRSGENITIKLLGTGTESHVILMTYPNHEPYVVKLSKVGDKFGNTGYVSPVRKTEAIIAVRNNTKFKSMTKSYNFDFEVPLLTTSRLSSKGTYYLSDITVMRYIKDPWYPVSNNVRPLDFDDKINSILSKEKFNDIQFDESQGNMRRQEDGKDINIDPFASFSAKKNCKPSAFGNVFKLGTFTNCNYCLRFSDR